MNRWRVGEDRGSKEMDRCPLTGIILSIGPHIPLTVLALKLLSYILIPLLVLALISYPHRHKSH
jgi:hypothetical protein